MAFGKPPQDDYGLSMLDRITTPGALRLITTPTPAPKSVFDEAREYIAEWEKADPLATHIAMVLDGETDLVTVIAGPELKPSQAAGILFTAAAMVAA